MSGEPTIPITHWEPLVGIFTQREDDAADSGCIRVQSNGVITHIQMAVAKVIPSNSCNTMLIFGIGKGFLTNLLFISQ